MIPRRQEMDAVPGESGVWGAASTESRCHMAYTTSYIISSVGRSKTASLTIISRQSIVPRRRRISNHKRPLGG